jgi:hypothetical protein
MTYDSTIEDKGNWLYYVPEGGTAPSLGDGVTYSRALGWQSPEGNFYGQERWVRDWYSAVFWDGLDYRIIEEDGAANTVNDLPIPGEINPRTGEPYGSRQPFEMWTTPRANWPPTDIPYYDSRSKDYWWWDVDTQSWKPLEWFFTCEGDDELPNPGLKRGAAHVVAYRDIKLMWNGYFWKRYSGDMIEGFQDVLDDLHSLTDTTNVLVEDHNELLEDFFGYQETIASQFIDTTNYVNEQFGDVSDILSGLSSDVSSYSSDLFISLSESNSLRLTVEQLIAESVELTTLAAELGIAPGDTGYQAALTALRNGIAPWINQDRYPLAITIADRTEIQRLINEVQAAKGKLLEAVSNRQTYRVRDFVKAEIADVTTAINDITSSFDSISSDLILTLPEANSLKLQLNTLFAESEELLAEAATEGLTAYGNSYLIALIDLQDELSLWIDQPTYPLTITADDRGTIKALFVAVKSKKAILETALITAKDNKVSTYVNDQIDEVGVALDALSEGIDRFSSDGYITLAEANALKQVRDSVVQESEDFIVIADSLDLDDESLLYSNAVEALVEGLESWVDNPPYPRAITPENRAAITSLLTTVQNTKVTIINAISGANAAVAVEGIGFDISQFRTTYDGFIRGFTTELILTFVSEDELSLRPNYGEYDYLKVNEQNIAASKKTSVFSFTPVLDWTESTQTLSTTTLQADRVQSPYYVYLADRSSGFMLRDYDYRGRLFCSNTAPSNNYLGDVGLGRNAVLVGTIDTNNEAKFVNILTASLISRTSDLKEVYREFSDFDLVFTSEDTLTLQLNYGCYGQIYIPESLYYIGQSREVTTTSTRLELNPDGTLRFVYTNILPSTLYYVYIGGDVDIYNGNPEGQDGRPLQPGDDEYNADKDLRLWLFLSETPPDNGRLAESYYGYWARHIGQVRTDANGKFIYSAGISAIRQTTLNATHLDGLAEVAIYPDTIYEFKVIKKKGTSGILMVGGEGILTYDPLDPILANRELVHKVNIHDTSQIYDEDNLLSPLSDGPEVSTLVGQLLYVYMANSQDFWGSYAGQLFVSTTPQVNGYISQNWPGNNARWVATLQLTPVALGTELVTNGDFTTDANWTIGTGWEYDSDNKYMVHTAGTASLSQSISLTEGDCYQVSYSLVECTSGSVAPRLADTLGSSQSLAGSVVANLVAGSGSLIELVPSQGFTVSVDNISVRKVNGGDFSGTYLRDGIGVITGVIEDANVATNTTWSSNRIQSELNNLRTMIAASGTFDQQKQTGIPVRLEYLDTTHVRLVPTVDSPNIIFPDLSNRTLPNSGLDMTISGSAGTFYYVWLSATDITMSTDAPVTTYAKMITRGEGSTKILVGYIGCSDTDEIAGTWNVFSLYGETAKQWGINIPTNGADITNTWYGAVTGPTKNYTYSRTGGSSWFGAVAWYMDGGGVGVWWSTGLSTVYFALGSYNGVKVEWYDSDENGSGYYVTGPGGSVYIWNQQHWETLTAYCNMSITLTHSGTLSSVGDIALTLDHNYTAVNTGNYGNNRWHDTAWTCTGQMMLSRPASDW